MHAIIISDDDYATICALCEAYSSTLIVDGNSLLANNQFILINRTSYAMPTSISVTQIPAASGGYSIAGKKIMIHDPAAPENANTVLIDADQLAGGGGAASVPHVLAGGEISNGGQTITLPALANQAANAMLINEGTFKVRTVSYTKVLAEDHLTFTDGVTALAAGDVVVFL